MTPLDSEEYVTAEIARSARDHSSGEREWRLVDVDDGVNHERQLWYRDCPPPVHGEWSWLYACDANGCETIDEALTKRGIA